MSSGSRSSSRNVNAAPEWSPAENKLFEQVLACYAEDTPDLWHKVSRAMGGIKTAEEVRRHYELLQEDYELIKSDRVPFPKVQHTMRWRTILPQMVSLPSPCMH
jgi:hypothetical protein